MTQYETVHWFVSTVNVFVLTLKWFLTLCLTTFLKLLCCDKWHTKYAKSQTVLESGWCKQTSVLLSGMALWELCSVLVLISSCWDHCLVPTAVSQPCHHNARWHRPNTQPCHRNAHCHRATVAHCQLNTQHNPFWSRCLAMRAELNEGREADERKTETERGILKQGMKEKCD